MELTAEVEAQLISEDCLQFRSFIAFLFLSNRKMLGLFRKHKKIPRSELLNEFMDSAKASNSPAQAIEIVQLASAFSLPVCESLTKRVMADFALSQEQKEALGHLTAYDSDGDSSSDSDSDISGGK